MIKKLITLLIRPKLEYAAVIWSPHKKKDIRKIKRMRRAALKMAPSLRDLPHEKILYGLKLPTLEQGREKGDLLAVYRASKDLEKIDRDDLLVWDRNTRRHEKKLKRTTCKRDIKKIQLPI